uniref:Uncharacterized protein n=1 Tax=Oryza sativa subsp. japonica TaxID=39947 RepID=Q6YXA7_ORYSJ|nr:hypothetical protein [Oryza sativa Japonica Group]
MAAARVGAPLLLHARRAAGASPVGAAPALEDGAIWGVIAAGVSLHTDYLPCVSHLTFAASFVDPRPHHDAESEMFGTVSTDVRSTSGDGLVLVRFYDSRNRLPTVRSCGGEPMREWSMRRQSHERDRASTWSASAFVVSRHYLNHWPLRQALPQPPVAQASFASVARRPGELCLSRPLPGRASP